jgi:mitochondrial distribution and morphology protein 31
MSSSIATTQLGSRHFWSTIIRDSVDAVLSRLPSSKPLNRPGLGQFPRRAPISRSRRSFYSSGAFFSSAKTSPNRVRHSCTSGGLLLLGLSAPSSPTSNVVATCTAAADTVIAGNAPQSSNTVRLARHAWRRGLHSRACISARRCKNTKASGGDGEKATASQQKPDVQKAASEVKPPDPSTDAESYAEAMSKYLQTQLSNLPKIAHRPTKEELLAAATGFWQRLKVRFKWFSIRSNRPWNADEWGAFLSWFMLGHIVWILVGTTTFFSLIIFLVNTVFAQGKLSRSRMAETPWAKIISRGTCQMGWRLPNPVRGRHCRLRVRNRPQVEGWSYHISQRLCLPPTRTDQVHCEEGLVIQRRRRSCSQTCP